MWPFYLVFLLPMSIFLARTIIILSPRLWAESDATVLQYELKSREFRAKFPSVQEDVHVKYLKAKYEYCVGNRTYTSKRVSMGILDNLYQDDEIEKTELFQTIKSGKIKIQYLKMLPNFSVITRSKDDITGDVSLIFALALIMTISRFGLYISATYKLK